MATYTAWLEYSATGEGLLEEIAVIHGRNIEQAIDTFFDALGYDEIARVFYRASVHISEGVNRERLGRWLTAQKIDSLERAMCYYGEFHLRFHFNAS